MSSSGKVLTIFLVIIAILLISLTALSLFFFQKETDRRKTAEIALKEYEIKNSDLENEMKESKRQNFVLKEKNDEADKLVNDLTADLELEKELRKEAIDQSNALEEQIKEVIVTKEVLTKEIAVKEELEEELREKVITFKQKIKELEIQLKTEAERGQKLGQLYEEEQEKSNKMEEEQKIRIDMPAEVSKFSLSEESEEDLSGEVLSMGIELGEIVVAPEDASQEMFFDETAIALDQALEGRVLSVDTETEFIIVSLGEEHGIGVDDVLSVYHNGDYLGDIKVTRLQPEMSAADLIPPLTVRSVQKNDQVKAK